MIEYIMIPFGMCVLVIQGLLGFLVFILVDIPKNIISFILDNFKLNPKFKEFNYV